MGICVVLGIILSIFYVLMMTVMIILERDKPKNMIIWSMIFLLTQIIGYAVYLIVLIIFYKKRNSFKVKYEEDLIYDRLISKNLHNTKLETYHDVFEFNNMAFSSKETANNQYEIFHDFIKFKESLIEDLQKAKNYILIEVSKLSSKAFQDIKDVLIEKAANNILVKLVHDSRLDIKLKKELKNAGIKVYRFSKYNTLGNIYSNLRNLISIDGNITYLANLNLSNNQIKEKYETAYTFMKIRGDIVQDINVMVHKDIVFSSGKYIPYEKHESSGLKNDNIAQFVANDIESDLELALIKAICMSKKSIQLQLSEFIPTESITSLLRFAINSEIQVRLMIPLKNNRQSNYFASRAYAKELALLGANVYLFDGCINFNGITIDDEYVIFGSYKVDREHLNTSLQTMLFIKDPKTVKNFNDMFNQGIENSYRINNAKYMLLREKFFKNFV